MTKICFFPPLLSSPLLSSPLLALWLAAVAAAAAAAAALDDHRQHQIMHPIALWDA